MKWFVMPHPDLDREAKVWWFLMVTCWLCLLTPFSRRGWATSILSDWVQRKFKGDRVSELEDINKQINALHAKRGEIMAEAQAKKADQLRSLEWLKHKSMLFTETYGVYGHKEFILSFASSDGLIEDVVGGFSSYFTLCGDDRDYFKNLLLRREEFGYSLRTCNADLFCEFIEKVQPIIAASTSLDGCCKVFSTVQKYTERTK